MHIGVDSAVVSSALLEVVLERKVLFLNDSASLLPSGHTDSNKA